MSVPSEPRLTLTEAATHARTSPEAVTEALQSGDLRDLRRSNVDKWVRARNASGVARRLGTS